MDDVFIVDGFAGKKRLEGEISVNGAKNASLIAMACSILFKDELSISNVPQIEDISRMSELLEGIGARITADEKNTLVISVSNSVNSSLVSDIAKWLRASVVLTGPLLGRFGSVSLPHPGGCVIGERPIDIFLDGFRKMGASVHEEDENYTLKAPDDGLRGAEIFLRVPSVTATEVFLMAGVLANGKTLIKNAVMEPEVVALAHFLNECGAKISGIGTPFLEVEGTGPLESKGKSFKTPPDRIEAGSFILLGALAGKDVVVDSCEPNHLDALLGMLSSMGVIFERGEDFVRVKESLHPLAPKEVKTHEYPGFPTDLQAPMTVLLTQAEGESLVFETIFEGRLSYIEALTWMGADILELDPHRVLVRGPKPLHGKVLKSPDLRAGMAYILAAILAEGPSEIGNAYNIDRGYERLENRLSDIGVAINRK